MKVTLNMLEKVPHVEFKHAKALARTAITGVSTDSRTVRPGDLFVALRGEQFDGHTFIGAAVEKGAVAVLAEAARWPSGLPRVPALLVEDAIAAYGRLARDHRRRFRTPVIAVAGSNGKTTTKEMIARVLEQSYSVLSTQGNLNNHIGVPATLLRMDRGHDVAVVELGTNHPGELDYLCSLTCPTHGLVTTIGHEHLEFFKTLEGVAEEEGSLYRHLARGQKGVAFVHEGDARIAVQAKPVRRRVRYAFANRGGEVRGKLLGLDDHGRPAFQFTGRRMRNEVHVQLSVPGRHNALNALAAAAVGLAFGVPAIGIQKALQEFHPPAKRMELHTLRGVLVINDAYTANADSAIASLRTLADTGVSGKRIAVLGDMLELGAHEAEEHARVGRAAAELKIDYLLTYGKRSAATHDAASGVFAVHYEQKNVLAEYLAELVTPGDAVLVKGSRGMHMEDVVTFLVERLQSPLVPVQ